MTPRLPRGFALFLACTVGATTLVGCTPKPDTADPIAKEFLQALENGDEDSIKQLIDQPQEALPLIESTRKGLQAEKLQAKLEEVDGGENLATARYSLTWTLPRERVVEYHTQMTLTKAKDKWTVRWQPTILHPRLGAHQHLELRSVPAKRANIVSSDGVSIYEPGINYRLLVDAKGLDARQVSNTSFKVSEALRHAHETDPRIQERSPEDLASAFQGAAGSYSVALLGEKEYAALKDELAGVTAVRFNPEAAIVSKEPNFAPDIMSRVVKIVEDRLDGDNGWKVTIATQDGAPIDDVEYHDAKAAPSIKVSLDRNVQQAAQDAVNLRPEMQAMMVAIRPSTGEILAIAQTAEADKDGPLALMGQYPPGSTFKMITAASGMENQGLNPGSPVPCPGTLDLYGRIVSNYNQFSLGTVPMETAFARSCNTSFAKVSTDLAPGQLKATAKEFGLGVDYNIAGIDTVTGSVPEGETPLDRTEAGYGQGLDLVSPFGVALVAATAAAGKTPVPKLIDGLPTEVSEEVGAPPQHVIDSLRQMMRTVVTNGTAAGMQAEGVIRGKTGEAEINDGSHAWFAGYREDDIAFATLIVRGGGSESAVAITDHFFINLDKIRSGVPPEEEGEGAPQAPGDVPPAPEAAAEVPPAPEAAPAPEAPPAAPEAPNPAPPNPGPPNPGPPNPAPPNPAPPQH